MTTRFAFLRDMVAVRALGDEAHYEQTARNPGQNASAERIIDKYSSHRERAALRIAFLDAYDQAADRQIVAENLFGPKAGWLEVRA